jgi:hypothetical protein
MEQVIEWERQHTSTTSPGVVAELGCTHPARGATTGAPHLPVV